MDLQAMQEADRRGLLNPQQKAAFDEAVRRGLVPGAQAQTPEPTPSRAERRRGANVAAQQAESSGFFTPEAFEGRSWGDQMRDQLAEYNRVLQPAANVMQDVNTGLFGWLPGVRENAESLGNIVRPAGVEAEGYGGRAAETAGMGLGAYLGGGGALLARGAAMGQQGLQQAAQAIRNNPGTLSTLRNIGGQMRDFIIRRPVAAPAIEAASGAGAGLGMEAGLDLANALDLGPTGTALAEQTGGIVGGFGVPAAAQATALSPVRALAGRVGNQFNELVSLGRMASGGQTAGQMAWGPGGERAAMRLQGLLPEEGRGAAIDALERQVRARGAAAGTRPAEGVTAADAAMAPVTPARATGNQRLLALERRLATEDPDFAHAAEAGRVQAEGALEGGFRGMFGPGRSPEQWRQSVIQSTAAPGAGPIPSGQTDDMLDAAYRTFETAYDAAKGFPVMLTRLGDVADADRPLRGLLRQAVNDTNLPAGALGPRARERLAADLDQQFQDVMRRTGRGGMPEGTVDSAALLDFRTALRREIRASAKAGAGSGKSAAKDRARTRALQNAEERVTEVLESQLPEDVMASLRATDARYRQHKIVEDAVWRGGDRELSPERLQDAVRRAESRGAFARGELETPHSGLLGEETSLISASRHGLDIKKTWGNPDMARRMTRGMDGDQISAVKADFNDELLNRSLYRGAISGQRLTQAIESQRTTMRALGYSADDMQAIDVLAANLRMVEDLSPQQLQQFITDKPGMILKGLAAIVGSSAGRAVARKLSGNMAHSLILAGRGARFGEEIAHGLVVDNAEALVRAALRDPDLMRALLTRPTDSQARVQEAARRLNAWLITVAEPGLADAQEE